MANVQAYSESLLDELTQVREAFLYAKARWIAANTVTIGDKTYSGLYQNDPGFLALQQAYLEARRHYQQVLNVQIPLAQEEANLAAQRQLIAAKEDWARKTHPKMVERIDYLMSIIQNEPSDSRQRYVARHEMFELQRQLQSFWNEHQKELVQ